MFSSSVIAAPPYLPREHNESVKEPGHLPPSWSLAKPPEVAPPAGFHLGFQVPLPHPSPASLLPALSGVGAALGPKEEWSLEVGMGGWFSEIPSQSKIARCYCC